MRPVDLFHLGPPKCATTWLYYCMKEHPEVCAPEQDEIHYYDMLYGRGAAWYESHFSHAREGQKLFDPTYTTISSPRAARRIQVDSPDAKFFFVLRHPIERAFSHYWHEKKFDVIRYDFAQSLDIYGLFEMWLGMGLLGDRLEEWFERFSSDQFHYVHYETLQNDSVGVYQNLCRFYEVDDTFKPSVLEQKMNVTGPKRTVIHRAANKVMRSLNMQDTPLGIQLSGKSEYYKGVAPDVYNRMLEVCMPDIEKMEHILGEDLSDWKIEK